MLKLSIPINDLHMNQRKTPQSPPAHVVFWMIWGAILFGLFVIIAFVGGGIPSGENDGHARLWVVLLAGAAAVIAMSIRFLLIPQVTSITKLLPVMIVGLAISELIGIVGIFVVPLELPQTRLALFVTSISCVIAFAPVYANALLQRKETRE